MNGLAETGMDVDLNLFKIFINLSDCLSLTCWRTFRVYLTNHNWMEKGKGKGNFRFNRTNFRWYFFDCPIKNLATFYEMVTLKCECEGFSTLKGKKKDFVTMCETFLVGMHTFSQWPVQPLSTEILICLKQRISLNANVTYLNCFKFRGYNSHSKLKAIYQTTK